MKIVDKIKQNSWNYFILEAVLWIAFILLWKRKKENITWVMLAEEKKILDSDLDISDFLQDTILELSKKVKTKGR